jgi:Cyclin, N-terminal domain
LKLDRLENNDLIIDSLFEKEAKTKGQLLNPLDGHQITKEYRTKMIDWMVEVCTSFRCYDRTWFLSVQIFDRYLSLMKGQKVLKNSSSIQVRGCHPH